MNKVFLAGYLSNLKIFDGKTRMCFSRVTLPNRSSYSITSFGDTVEQVALHQQKPVIAEGYLKNVKQKDGNFHLEVICTKVQALLEEKDKEQNEEVRQEVQAKEKSGLEDIPF